MGSFLFLGFLFRWYTERMSDFFFFGYGLILGSFLNVVLFRGAREESFVTGRSRCLVCQKMIAWYDNIPLISYILLRGRCRHCRVHISWQYPLVELITGLWFVLVGQVFFDATQLLSWLETGWLLILGALLILIVVSDVKSMEISLTELVAINIVTLVYLMVRFWAFETQLSWQETALSQGLLGGIIAGGFFFALVYFSRETWMGWGDVWIGAFGGLAVGWQYVLPMLTLSFALGAFYGVGLLVFHQKSLKTQVPFAPFLVLGIVGVVFGKVLLPEIFWYISWQSLLY